ncbi:MAG: DNA cytosine methyltransferase [Pseudomonadota bacterium]
MRHNYYDFFAGGGMAGLGLGPQWRCSFANDIDPKKAKSYRLNSQCHGAMQVGDVATVQLTDLPGQADLAWASFPCQDLSVAGKGAGLAGQRSGTFKPFWRLMRELHGEGRGPKIIALENVTGAITSKGGRDFATLSRAFSGLGYQFGALIVDAIHFLPQSRPRVFFIGLRRDLDIPYKLAGTGPSPVWHSRALVEGQRLLSQSAKARWIWWNAQVPAVRNTSLPDVIEPDPADVAWHSAAQTRQLLSLASPHNLTKLEAAKTASRASATPVVGTVYRRTRRDASGSKVQRAEFRFDEVAGCLRTPAGGSSRQIILFVDGARVRSRLLSGREAAALMGLPASYKLPERYTDTYKLVGDGVAVPVVGFLNQELFEPILQHNRLRLVA